MLKHDSLYSVVNSHVYIYNLVVCINVQVLKDCALFYRVSYQLFQYDMPVTCKMTYMYAVNYNLRIN